MRWRAVLDGILLALLIVLAAELMLLIVVYILKH